MSVEELEPLLAKYSIGNALSLEGIASGVENSNFLLKTEEARYILTLYEKRVKPEELPFFLHLLQHLAASAIPCPMPISDADGHILQEIKGRPAAIVSFLEGRSPHAIRASHIGELGKHLALLHKAGKDFPASRPNNFSLERWFELYERIKEKGNTVKPGLVQEIHDYLQFLAACWPSNLPKGIIHADLFPDNVFFKEGAISGIIDFYFACTDYLMYDVAICMNAWCFEQGGEFNLTKATTLLNSYHQVRPLQPEELEALPVLAQGAALRFLLTRLYDWLHTVEGALVQLKDPLEYLRKMRFHHGITNPSAYGLEMCYENRR